MTNHNRYKNLSNHLLSFIINLHSLDAFITTKSSTLRCSGCSGSSVDVSSGAESADAVPVDGRLGTSDKGPPVSVRPEQ